MGGNEVMIIKTEDNEVMIKQICDNLHKGIDKLYIRSIQEDEGKVYIYLSDIYGNDKDDLPFGFDLSSGESIYVDLDTDCYGKEYDIPIEYQTYRSIVLNKLQENLPEVLRQNLTWGLYLPMNVIYSDYISEISLPQLYALCYYFFNLYVSVCTEDEKGSVFLLRRNRIIYGFLQLSMEEKMELVGDYYFTPRYIQKLFDKADEILVYAEQKKVGNRIDEDKFRLLETEINELKKEVDSLLSVENDSCCSIEKMQEKINETMTNVEQEILYCESKTEELSNSVTAHLN